MNALPMIATARGDAHDAHELHARFDVFLQRVCAEHLRDPDDAADALQETWLAVLRHPDLVQCAHSLASLLRAIARNKCRDLRRRQRCRPAVACDFTDAACEPPDRAPGPDDCCAESDAEVVRREQLACAIDRLPPRLRRTACLRYVDGCGNGEISARLGIASGTVKSRLSRARAVLARDCAVAALVAG